MTFYAARLDPDVPPGGRQILPRRHQRLYVGVHVIGRGSVGLQHAQGAHGEPVYWRAMPIDVPARVIANRRLSGDYNVLTLHAPAIAAGALPGHVVMLKPGIGFDPLLRRPFSVFEILRDSSGAPIAITILSKRIGPSTRLIYDAEPGHRIDCLGPLGRPFALVQPPSEAWMIAGGVGLPPFPPPPPPPPPPPLTPTP